MKVLSALLLMSCILVNCEEREYIVHPKNFSSSNTSFILEDYSSRSNLYFTSYTNFTFLPGNHTLSNTLTIASVTNLILKGLNETCIFMLGKFIILNSSEIQISKLIIRHSGKYTSSSFSINHSFSLFLLDIQFYKNDLLDTYSRAASIYNSIVTIINCSFYDGYSDEGGALKITFSKVVFLNNIKFEHNRATIREASIYTNKSELLFNGNISFGNNKIEDDSKFPFISSKDGKGGAIYALNSSVNFRCVSTITEKSKQSDTVTHSSLMTFVNCQAKLFGNSGREGGAIYSSNSSFSFEGRTDIVSNTAIHGGAIASQHSKFFFPGPSYITGNHARNFGGAIAARASTISFHGNVLLANNSVDSGGGGLYGFQLILKTLFNLTFQNNYAVGGGGLCLIESEFIVSGYVRFIQNEAYIGGGMYLQDTQIVMKPHLIFIFHKNKAEYGGGIIYIDPTTYYKQCFNFGFVKTKCFFYVTPSTTHLNSVHFYFHDNVALAGSDIFGGNLDVCDLFFPDEHSKTSGLNFIFNVSTINHTEYDNSSISSSPLYICHCEQEIHKCANEITLHMPHGKKCYLSVVAVGQNNSPVPSEIIHSFRSSNGAELRRLTSDYNENSTSCQNISFQLLSAEKTETFRLYPSKCESEKSALLIIIQFDPCPPGFELTTNICECENNLKRITESKIVCDIETSLVKHPGKLWIQPILTDNLSYSGFMWTNYCPKLFCKNLNLNTNIWLNFSSSMADNQCQSYRTGIVCGSCKKDNSLVLNSLDCRVCNNSFIALTVVFIFAGIAGIVVLLFLHITVAFGTINGLILYANVVNISKDLFFPPEQTKSYVLPIFIAWLNLDFGISTCYFRGLDIYLYTWLQFAFPFYLWGLIGIIIITSRYSTKVARLLGSNPVSVLATVILMSYTKLLHTSYSALSYTTIKYSNNIDNKKVWKLDPNILYLKDKHIPLAAFSICVIIFLITPYIFVILLGYQIQAISHKKQHLWINKFKPLLDSYYAPYQKNTRFWTGFLLVVRTCLYITYTLTEDSEVHVILIAESSIFGAILLIPWLRLHVYEKKYLEKLEASFIFNILILSAGTCFIKSTNADETILPLFSAGIAFIEFIGIVFFHIVMCLENWKIKIPLKVWKVIYTSFLKKVRKISVQQRASDEVVNANMENFTTTSISIREPLLVKDNTEL